MFRKWTVISFLLTLAMALAAQPTRVRGIVRDGESGAPLPFVGIYFDGTDIGISTDMDGRYSLETRNHDAKVLTASLLGYESYSVSVTPGVLTEVNFVLFPDPTQLDAALVKPDNRYLRSILARLDESLPRNDPENASDWNSRLYSRIELDLANADDLFRIGLIEKNLGYVRQYSDTSAITGKAYIPIMISENLSDVFHNEHPDFTREVMRASRISGFREDNTLRQFTGAYLLKTNFFAKNITLFNLDVPNPAAAASQLIYDYYLVDSLQVEGRKNYVLRFHPKKLVTSPALDGEMHIDAEDFGISSVQARLSEVSNVNWLQHIHLDIRNRRLPDGRWFYGEEKIFLDFSIVPDERIGLISFQAQRQMAYGMPHFEPTTDKDVLSADLPVIMRNVIQGDESFWEQVRPFELSRREKGIFTMVDDFQARPFYKWTERIGRTLITGFVPFDQPGLEYGPWERTFVFNETEGFRLRVGGRTRRELTEKFRLGGYLAYGFKSRTLGWQVAGEFMFGREKLRKLTLLAQDDFTQLGSSAFSSQNTFSSLISPYGSERMTRVRNLSATYEHDLAPNIEALVEWNSLRLEHNEKIPFIRPDGSIQPRFSVNQIHGKLRITWDEKVDRGPFGKTHLYTLYPIVEIGMTGGIKGITKDDIGFFRIDAGVSWKSPSSLLGFSRMQVKGGFILGDVPYPMLNLHAGNQTYLLDRNAFSCMDYYEFVSNRWVEGSIEHNFNGFFLGKIPGIRRLNLREVVLARAAWGTYAHAERSPFLLPSISSTLETPYVEAGAGIANILRLFRVDAVWRLTHRREHRNFTVNVGVEFNF